MPARLRFLPPAKPAALTQYRNSSPILSQGTESRHGVKALGPHRLLAAASLGGRAVGIRIEPAMLMFFDPDTRQLLRVRPNPLTVDEGSRLRGACAAGPPPGPSSEPVTVQRCASASGVILACRQPVSLGRIHAGQVVPVAVSETTMAINLGDDDTLVVTRTTTPPVRNIKAFRVATAE